MERGLSGWAVEWGGRVSNPRPRTLSRIRTVQGVAGSLCEACCLHVRRSTRPRQIGSSECVVNNAEEDLRDDVEAHASRTRSTSVSHRSNVE